MNNHPSFDKDEQMIHEAFSKIEIDTHSLKRKMREASYKNAKRPMRLSFAMMAMVALLVVSGTVYAATGGLEELIARFNPNFGEYAVAPFEPIISDDQGIRLEVYGTGVFGNTILIYYSIQDISGENRLDEHITPGRYHITNEENTYFGAFTRLLHFDTDSNTLYYEAMVTVYSCFIDQITLRLENLYDFSELERLVVSNPVFIQGDWQVTLPVGNAEDNVILMEDVTEKNIHISRLVISPLGVYIEGVSIIRSHPQDEERRQRDPQPWPAVNIELSCGGYVEFAGVGGSPGYSAFLTPESPIDTGDVVAIVVYGTRIPLPLP